MESKLPKPRTIGTFTSSASVMSYRSKIESIKSQMANQDAPALIKSMENTKPATEIKKSVDENKAPTMQAKTTIASRNKVVPVKPVQKRPAAPAPSVIEPKRANLKTTMKVIRPVRPTTITTHALRSKTTTPAVNVTAPSKVNTAGPKPSKWDLKGRLEYTSNELSALKQKHKEVTIQYKNVEDEIVSLRESESSCRSKVEDLERTASGLSKQVVELKKQIAEFESKERGLIEKLANLTELQEKTAASLLEYKEECRSQKEIICQHAESQVTLKKELEASNNRVNNLEIVNKDLLNLVQDLDKERRGLHNTIQELKGNIRVFCRVRPKIPKEAAKKYVSHYSFFFQFCLFILCV